MEMKFKALAGVTLLMVMVVSVPAGAQAPSQPRTQTVTYKSGTEIVTGYLALPEGSGRHPAIVVIHEWWGLTDWVKEQAQRLAAQGYVALAVDLYRGQSTADPDAAHELMRGLPNDRALRDLEAAFHYLSSRKDVNRKRIGSIGWCMGGGFSLQLAVHEPKLAACVVNYGALPTDPADIARIHAPVLGNFGAEDRGITPAAVQAFQQAMKSAGKRVDVKIYDGAGHGFENPNNKAGYRQAAAEDAWQRITNFLRIALQ
jgi:carboxymethylenebutenolidase